MDIETMMMAYPITRKAWFQAGMVFYGLAIPCDKTTIWNDTTNGNVTTVGSNEGPSFYGTFRSEKVLKFNRKAMRQLNKPTVEKVDPRYRGGDDLMIVPVGKPGSDERKAALVAQYAMILASGEEVSPFSEG